MTNANSFLGRIVPRCQSIASTINGDNTLGQSKRFWAIFGVITAVLFLYPFVANTFSIMQKTNIFIWTILALSLTFVWGYGGIFNFGQTAIFGIGAYSFGVIGINLIDVTGGRALAFIGAMVIPGIAMILLGYFMFYAKISGLYVAIITLAMELIFHLGLSRTSGQQYRIGDAHLGGLDGMTGIPDIGIKAGSTVIELGHVGTYYMAVIVLIASYLGLRYLLNSYYGYIIIAVRDDELRTETFGYDVRKTKIAVFSLGASMAGLAGALYAAWGNFVDPGLMGLVAAAMPVIWITVGGRETLIGAVIGAYILQEVEQELGGLGSEYSIIVIGIILIAAILLFPNGIVPAVRDYWHSFQSKRTEKGDDS